MMAKYSAVAWALVVLVLFSLGTVQAEASDVNSKANIRHTRGYFSLGGGAGLESTQGHNDGNFSLEAGIKGVPKGMEHGIILGVGFGFIFGKGNAPDTTFDFAIPWWDRYCETKIYRDGPEYAMFLRTGLETFKGLYISGLGGFSILESRHIAYDHQMGWSFYQGSTYKGYGLYGGGITYFPPKTDYVFGVDYDSRRGITGTIGIEF